MFDPLTQAWTDPCPDLVLPDEREKHLMIPVKTDQIFVMGGNLSTQSVIQATGDRAVRMNCELKTFSRNSSLFI